MPLLEDGSFFLSESPAILSYICERYGPSPWYGPPGSERKATIDSYLHSHHTGTRQLARLIQPHIRPDLNIPVNPEKEAERIKKVLGSLEDGWLRDDPYIAGQDLSIADILAYEEMAQVYMTGLLPQWEDYSRVAAWIRRMQQIPLHDESHVSLTTLGNLREENDTPMDRRLALATKMALKAYKEAQQSYVSSL